MDAFFIVRVAAVIVIALIYMLFDLFNRRNVPSVFAYATIGLGTVFTIFYLNITTIAVSAAIAIVIGALGYLVYRAGQLGGADVIEFAAISLILPIQPVPYLSSIFQFNLPFIISTFIATGVVALAMIPLYYLPLASSTAKKGLWGCVKRSDIMKGAILAAAYLAFLVFLAFGTPASTIGLILVLVVMLSSIVTMTFEKPITDSMVEYIKVDKLEEGDMIALNLMSVKEIREMKRKVKGFDRLATMKIINEMKGKRISKRLPVYRKAMPLALPIFIGIILSLLFGNLLLLII
ncbi:MAG: hypothetical protein LVQ95_04685 [Candidatus Micrarchaeales archaeon]|nr:hypothetical protein [Candidatus Micrarchaeales archaeon]